MARVATFLLILMLCGCSSMSDSLRNGVIDLMATTEEDESRPPKELEEITQQVVIDQLWQRNVGAGQGKSFLKLEMVVSGDSLYIADYKGYVFSLDKISGEERWEVDTTLAISGALGVGDENLFFGTTDAEVVALKLNDGDTSWTSDVSGEVLSIPQFDEEIVVVRTGDGAVTALEAESGQEKWSFVSDVPALSLRGTSSPVIKKGGVLTGYANGNLLVLRLKDGMQIWQTSIATPKGRGALSRMVDVDADPLAGERYVYAATYNGGLVAVDVRNGEIVWRRSDLSSYKKMAADWLSLYVIDINDHIVAQDQNDGALKWQQDKFEYRQLTSPVLVDDYLLTADFEGYLHILSTEDGRVLGRVKVSSSPIKQIPLVDEGVIYVQDVDGEVTALRLKMAE